MTAALFTRDPMLLSLVTFAGQLPWVLAGTFAGAFVDRHDQQRVMFWSDAVRAVIASLFTLALFTGHGSIALLLAFALVMGVVETLRDSATLAIVPRLVLLPSWTRPTACSRAWRCCAWNWPVRRSPPCC